MDDKDNHLYSQSNACDDDPEDISRTGTLWTALAYLVTALLGPGVLSLSWSVAQLGWVAGPVAMIAFALVSLYSAFLLVDSYRFPDPVSGPSRNRCYRDAVRVNLGERRARLCAFVQYLCFYGLCVAYTITASISIWSVRIRRYSSIITFYLMKTRTQCHSCSKTYISYDNRRAIGRSNCYHKNGHDSPCHFSQRTYMIIYGVIEVILSQIPNFHKLWGLSIAATIMSLIYATLGFGLGIAKVIENGEIHGKLGGSSTNISFSRAHKVWRIFQALGDIAFAFPFTPIAIEIQDTLKSPPPENRTMKKASSFSTMITTVFFMLCGCLGYAAFGENAPGNLLTGFGFYEPYWLIDFANACIVVNLIGAYQIYCQPIFALIEGWICHKWPNKKYIKKGIPIRVPFFGLCRVNLFRLCWRTAFVVSATCIAILFPLFNDVLGLLGALTFWPLVVYFPVEIYIVQKKVQRWTLKWSLLQSLSVASLFVSVVTAGGCTEGLINDKDT